MHHVEAVIDRVVVRNGVRPRLAESIHLAIRLGGGLVLAVYEKRAAANSGAWRERLFSTEYACPRCKISYEELQPRTFSFNSPYGACPRCEGLGVNEEFDPELVLPDKSLSLSGGAVALARRRRRVTQGPFQSARFSPRRASVEARRWSKLKPKALAALVYGDKLFPGILKLLEADYEATESEAQRQRLDVFRGRVACPECGGARLRPEARSVRIGGKAIHEITRLTVAEAGRFFAELSFPEQEHPIAEPLCTEIGSHLSFMERLGLDYLTLDRPADTLSGGELQRVRLVTGLGSGLVGVCYVLDEPSIGLHPRDNQRLIDAMPQFAGPRQHRAGRRARRRDHAPSRLADRPRAGRGPSRRADRGRRHPGRRRRQSGIAHRALPERRPAIPVPERRRRIAKTRMLILEGAATNNLKQITVPFPLSVFTCVTGVSGSGKSSLLNETLARALAERLGGLGPKPGPHLALRGANRIDKVVQIDQSPIGRTPRSNPATYTGVFDEIRKVFATTRDARQFGYKPGRFSFNVKGGRCEECQGQGLRRIEMNFLPDLYVTCPVCEGKRFNRQTLGIRYRDKSIADVLELRVDDAVAFFENFPVIARLLSGAPGGGPGVHHAGPGLDHALRRRGAAGQAGHRAQPGRHRQHALRAR